MSDPTETEAPPRMLPRLDDHNRAFWTGGADGRLLLLWCKECARWVHPPAARCPEGHEALEPRQASGSGTVLTFTVNHHRFNPAVPVPYVIAIVELEEQADLRMITNLVGCDPDSVRVGMSVRVAFEPHGEIFVPVFEPSSA